MSDIGRILIADDDVFFANTTADLLRLEGYECLCALNSITAAEMLVSSSFDLLIADIRMPGNSQLEFIQKLPHIAEGMPVILITGYPSISSAIQSIQLPVTAYMVKPIEFDQLLANVRNSIANFRIYRSVCSIQQRLQDWNENLAIIKDSLNIHTFRQETSAPVYAFLKITFQNIVGALSDLNYMASLFSEQKVDQETCHLFNCPKLDKLTGALEDTIDTLESTKNAFKSKELGELRRKLENIMK